MIKNSLEQAMQQIDGAANNFLYAALALDRGIEDAPADLADELRSIRMQIYVLMDQTRTALAPLAEMHERVRNT